MPKSTIEKVLCFDFGLKYIGISIGQSITGTASPLPYILAKKGIPNWNEITQLIQRWKPTVILIGNPLNMDGSEGDLTPKIREFQQELQKRFHIPIELQDERLSTKEAMSLTDDPLKAHSIAAALITESWLKNF